MACYSSCFCCNLFYFFSEKIIIFSIVVGNSLYIMMYSFCSSVIVVVCVL